MEFCPITPTVGLELYASNSKRHMVLAQQFVQDDDYAQFYLNQQDSFIFLDNGVYEGEYDPRTFLHAIKELQPDVAVLPDVICKGGESIARSSEFILTHANEFPKVNWMFIPQGRDIEEWHRSLQAVRTLYARKPSVWIGLTRFLPTHTCKGDLLIRVKLAKIVKAMYPHTPIHCMGMNNGSLNELTMLAQQGIVESIDSSAPIWRGWKGYSLTDKWDHERWNKHGTDVDFSLELPKPSNQKLIEENLEAVYASIRI